MSTASSSGNNEPSTATSHVASNLADVQQRIRLTCENFGRSPDSVRLVAVSKTKPSSLIVEAYETGHRTFGENYVQELCDKAEELPTDISWHMIGPIQSNKASLLVKTVMAKSTLTVETVATLKLAKKLDNAMAEYPDKLLNIYIQVNTSGEDTKSGVERDEVVTLCRDILQQCPRLRIQGLMTIGAPGDRSCFDTLRQCREEVRAAGLPLGPLELSMGMSDDFEVAIEKGATNVRIGSTIFGARDYSNK
jgi:pyridoxal phosphate enzyme (YggS family)